MIKLRNILFILITTFVLLMVSQSKVLAWENCFDLSGLYCYYGYGNCNNTCCVTKTDKLYQCTCESAYRITCDWIYKSGCPDGIGYSCSSADAGDYCYGSGLGSCCNPGPCGGCTPTCPTGYSSTPNSCSTTTATCKGSNGCSACTRSITCYLNETNIAPDMPTSISMIVDGFSYLLSSNPNTPTKIKYPSTSPSVQVSVPTISVPPTSGGVGYRFLADNYGVNDEWEGWIDCSGDVGEDFCIQNTSNTQNFVPSSLTVLQTLKENAGGKISGLNYTNNNCDTDVKYSLPKEGYYTVDRIPDVTDGDGNLPTKSSTLPGYATDMTGDGCSSSTYTGKDINNPLHVNIRASDPDGNDEIEAGIFWLSKDASVPKITNFASGCDTGYYSVAPKLCCPTNTTYINGMCRGNTVSVCPANLSYRYSENLCTASPRPTPCPSGYRIVASGICCPTGSYYNNSRGRCEISPGCPSGYRPNDPDRMAPYSPATCCPSNTTLSGSFCTAIPRDLTGVGSVNDIGLLIKKDTTWTSPSLYFIDDNNNWRPLVDGSDGNKYIRVGTDEAIAVRDLSVTQSTDVLFDFKLEFKDTVTKPYGLYNLYIGGLDNYMLDTQRVDQSRLFDVTDWGIDLSDPTVGDISQNVEDIQNILLSWNVADLESNITDIVINGYRTAGDSTTLLELFAPPPPYAVSKGAFLPQPIPADEQIGILSDLSSAWHFTNTAKSRVETDKINIGDNEGGNINIYVTGYDEGCNRQGSFENIDLNPWVTSYGGTVYSSGGIINAAKDVSDVDALDGVFQNVTKENLDTGTETISSRASNITNLVKNFGVTAPNIYDTNDRKTYWYDHFTDKLNNEKVEGAQNFTENWNNNDTNVSSNCTADVCYYKGVGDISIRSGFVCDKKTLFMTEGSITINPDITTSSTSTGCIFFAKGNIHVTGGGYKSAAFSTTQYDYLDGYLIAQGRIIFDLADAGADLRDGIEVKGGLVAFGDGVTGASAIYILRNLKLFSQTSPTVVLVYDPRYPIISSQFFGTEAPIYKQEVGFKNF